MEIICAKCNTVLPNQNDECNNCGANKKIINLYFSDKFPKMHESLSVKVKDRTKNSKKNPVLKFFKGHQIYVDTGEWVNKEQTIDTIQDKYYEHIETFDGKMIHHCSEKLSEHKNRGSAKFNKIKNK